MWHARRFKQETRKIGKWDMLNVAQIDSGCGSEDARACSMDNDVEQRQGGDVCPGKADAALPWFCA